jgi:virginiamycin B lyase
MLLSALMTAVLATVLFASPSPGFAAGRTCVADCVTTYDLAVSASALGPGNGPFAITRGPADSEWFTWGDAVGRIDEAGTVTRYPVPTVDPLMRWMVRGKHGKMWFSEMSKIGWIKTSSAGTQVREYNLPHQDSFAISLVAGPHGRMYFSEQTLGAIGRLNPSTGHVREFKVPSGDPLGLTMGPDRALWFVERAPEKVGRLSLSGHVQEWALPKGAQPQRIAVGRDGALWFSELGTSSVGRITTSGVITHYRVPGGPVGITTGRDGQFYVTLFRDGALARVNLRGEVTGRWALPGATFALQNGLGKGYDIWATDTGSPAAGGHVYRITPYTKGS